MARRKGTPEASNEEPDDKDDKKEGKEGTEAAPKEETKAKDEPKPNTDDVATQPLRPDDVATQPLKPDPKDLPAIEPPPPKTEPWPDATPCTDEARRGTQRETYGNHRDAPQRDR